MQFLQCIYSLWVCNKKFCTSVIWKNLVNENAPRGAQCGAAKLAALRSLVYQLTNRKRCWSWSRREVTLGLRILMTSRHFYNANDAQAIRWPVVVKLSSSSAGLYEMVDMSLLNRCSERVMLSPWSATSMWQWPGWPQVVIIKQGHQQIKLSIKNKNTNYLGLFSDWTRYDGRCS